MDRRSSLTHQFTFLVGGIWTNTLSLPIHRLDFLGEDIIGTEVIDAHNGQYLSPALYNAPFDFCV